MQNPYVVAGIAGCLIGSVGPAVGQIEGFTCTFTRVASSEGLKSGELVLGFVYDRARQKAALVGNIGATEVLAHAGRHGLTFLEFLPSGAVQSTTIASDRSAVHSRHTLVGPNEILPSQYYGRCEP